MKHEGDDTTKKSVADNVDRDTTHFSDNASISEQNDSCPSTEEQKNHDTMPDRNEQLGTKVLSESAAMKDLLARNLLAHSKPSLPSNPSPSAANPSAANIEHRNQQNAASTGYMESYNHTLGGSVKADDDGVAPSSVYRDYSRLPCAEGANSLVGTSSTSGKEPPFPVKLHKILSKLEFTDVVSWLPHGRSWRVLKPKAFEEKVVPLYFRHAKYASFMRQVTRTWYAW